MKPVDKAQRSAKEYIGLALILVGGISTLNYFIDLNIQFLREVPLYASILGIIIGLYLSGFIKSAEGLSKITGK